MTTTSLDHRHVRAYLDAVKGKAPAKKGWSKETRREYAEKQLAREDITSIQRVKVIQRLLDIDKEVDNSAERTEPGFVKYAKGWADKHGITYEAFREFGVEAEVLRRAGIQPTNRKATNGDKQEAGEGNGAGPAGGSA